MSKRHVKLFKNGRNQAVRIPREFELPGEDAMSHHQALDLFERTTVIALALDRRNVHNFSNGLCIDPVVLPVRADKPDIGFKTLVEHDGEIRHLAGYHDCGLRRSRDQAQSD